METVACALCGSNRSRPFLRLSDLTHHISTEEFTIVSCEGCRLRYLNPRPTPEEIGQYYPDRYFGPLQVKARTGFEQGLKRFSRRVKRWIMEDFYGYPSSSPIGPLRTFRKAMLWPEKVRRSFRGRDIVPWIGKGRLLDVGCGSGGNLATLQEQGWDVYGVDMSPEAVTQARARVGDRVHAGGLNSAPFADGSFDVILFSHSLEHLFNPKEALAQARRLLQSEGLLVLAVPNAGSLEARLFKACWFPWELPRHLYHFERDTLTRLLEGAGFRAVRLRTGIGSLYFMASLERAWTQRFHRKLPMRKLIERCVARPFCLIAGHMGCGTEITVHAVKA